MTADRLRRELEDSFRNRAMLYWTIFQELSAAMGAEQAEAILSAAIYKRGRQVAEAAFSRFGAEDARALGEAFLAASPDEGRLYPTHVERFEDGIAFQVRQCPLKSAWVEAGLSHDELATMCRIAGRFDNGLFECTGVEVSTRTWRPGQEGCCAITLRNRPAAGSPPS